MSQAKKKTTQKSVAAKRSKKKIKKAVVKPARKTAQSSKPKTAQAKKTQKKQTNRQQETKMKNTTQQFDAFIKDANGLGQESLNAFVKSGTIFAKGFEDLVRASIEIAQESAEKQAQYVQDFIGAKTLNEITETQNKIAQANFNDFMSGATKISEIGVKLLTEASEPINEQINKGVQKAQNMAA